MGLRDIELTLPPGFRFYPSDEELVCHYLHNKVANAGGVMVEVDLHTHEPWELPDVAKLSTNEWYFFSFRDRKYATGLRTNRATKSGYWKATGKDASSTTPRLLAAPSSSACARPSSSTAAAPPMASRPAGSCMSSAWRIPTPHPRVFYKKKADALDYGAMDNEQEIAMARSAVASRKYSSSSDPGYYSPPFPALGSNHHHYQLPPSSEHHHHGGAGALNDFSAMALLQHNSIFDFHAQPLDSGSSSVLAAAPGTSRDGSGEQCGGGGALMDLGLEDHYNSYNSLMQM
ncbi:hypothetical protein PR202_ga03124 [Eleusine coracana subsp. coracana]|uniref:NAC domain-containing protein n=1 Tax=Eleusine coracana subsp. coracana TaxID=191504 RepID=A0AAV5BL93_ELECO|nr:hypothetical protein PR202_ga03124 [Eleusine coracana subsp. coracana]